MKEVTDKVSELMKPFGVEVLDVRIKRTDLPTENQRAIFERMRAERERRAKQYRSEGDENPPVSVRTPTGKAVILAEAAREAQVERGKGDAKGSSGDIRRIL